MYPPIRSSALRSFLTLLLPLLLIGRPSTLRAADAVVISEFMASNTSGLVDEDGQSSDWIEIFNAGSAAVPLAGWRLTDDALNLSKWTFPATNLPPNGFLLIWASSKDRRLPGKPLHANFGLSADGEYLALVRPDDSLATEFKPFPKQYDNISYGVFQQIDASRFIQTNSLLKVYVPSNNTLGLSWTTPAFSDSGWQPSVNGVGYEQSVSGFAVKNYKANTIVGNLATADSVISTPSLQANVYSENRNVINYFNSGGTGNYLNDSPFPGLDLVNDIEDFVVEVTGIVTIPTAGAWTFGVNSDDGFRLQIGSSTMSYPDPRGPGDTLSTFNFPTAGDYNLRLVFYERGGGSELELFAAQGTFVAWNSTNFRLVGDPAGGLTVRSLPTGQTVGFKNLIKTDLQSVLYNRNASAYLRFPFVVGSPGTLGTLTLQAKYDDGFAAYLNGTLVATRNAPGFLSYNSTASSERADADAIVYETIDLSPYLGSLVAGNNVLAIQGLNRASNDDDFLFLAELSEFKTTLLTNNYFATATPAAYNSSTIYNKVRDTHFSHDRGFYETNFNLVISCETPGATIRYTLDGTEPTAASGTVYTSPIAVTKTTTVRAAAFKTGFVASDVDTHTYLYTRDIITQSATGAAPAGWPASWGGNVVDYGMDPDIVNAAPWKDTIQNDLKSLPSFSVVMKLEDLFDPATGIYANPGGDTLAWERGCSLELIQPDGSKGFQENCGIRIRGGFSRSTSNPKHALRFFFRQEYGAPKLNFPVFGKDGAKEYDKFDLRTTQNYSWAFQGDAGSIWLRDQFSRDTQLAMGRLAERGNWFHLYINGQYWGLYNTDERAEASFGESYLGGAEEDYDTIKVGPDQGYNIYATDGNLDAWSRLWQAAVTGFANDADYFRIQGLNPDGTPNPAYENLLDVPNLIDYMLVIIYGGNLDAPISNFLGNSSPNNWFGIRDRTGAHGGFRFISHDAEHTLLNVNEDRSGPFAAGDPTQGSGFEKSSPQYIYTRLWANAEFRMLCADHIQRHFFNGGALTVSNAQARLDRRTNEIFRALVPESARWGDSKRSTPITRDDFLASYNNVRNNYLPGRGTVVINQLRGDGLFPTLNAPGFSQLGGFAPFGYPLVLTVNNAQGSIYYTLDGTDPRQIGGGINPSAAVYSAPIVLNTARTVRARVKNGTVWSAIVEATFYPLQNFDGLAITEIMYNPPGEGAVAGDELEFIELKNTTANTLDLSGLSFTEGISFIFTNGTTLGAGDFFVLARNATEFKKRYPASPINGVFTGRLDNGGETIRLKHTLGGTVFTVTYDDDLPWPLASDGFGFSLVPRDANPLSNSENGSKWRASANQLGSPGADDPVPTLPSILINEALTHTDLPDVDEIELYNPTDATVSLAGWFLSDDAANPRKYRIPNGRQIAAHSYAVFTEADFNADLTSSNSFRLSSTGDQIYLLSGDANTNLTGYSHGFTFGASANGVSFGRYVNSQGEEHFPSQKSRTFGATNSGPLVGPVVINEIQYHPDLSFDEFIELHNITSTNVPLYDLNAPTNTWKLSGFNFTFPQNQSLPAGGYLIVSPLDPTLFRSRYSIPAGVQIFGPATGNLQDSGERLELLRPDAPNTNEVPYIVVDAVRYNDREPWPVVADGSGPSLQRLQPDAYGDDPVNWFTSGITPGRANLPNVPPSVVLTSPAANSTFLPPASITLEAAANDTDGAILKVEFYSDGVKLGEDSAPPYSYTWVNATPGTHSLTAKAYDSGLSIAVSDPVQISVVTPTATTVIARGSEWKYLDNNVPPGVGWTNVGFNDVSWKAGPAQLGYGDGDEATVVSFGPNANAKYITTWFRRSFALTNVTRYLTLDLAVLRDDGAVVYLNGEEVFRSNMPEGSITPSTPALSSVGGGDETSTFYSKSISPSLLREGTNVVAVEIHQSSGTSTDISFDLELLGTLAPIVPTIQLTSPANNTTFIAPAKVSLAAAAADPENGINRVEFFSGSTRIGQDNTAPYTFDWVNVTAGNYTLRAIAFNTLGLARTSAPVSITVKANLAPTVALTQPTNGTVLISPTSVALEAEAADGDGTVSQVEFFVDDTSIGTDTSSPYSIVWAAPTPGSHVLKAVATDDQNVSVTSVPVNLTITNRITYPFTLVAAGSLWHYNDLGVDLGTAWHTLNYDDVSWAQGPAQLGYSPDENDEATVLQFGSDVNNKHITSYFRRTFQIDNPADVSELQVRYLRDDGIVVYLNGQVIVRDNFADGDVLFSTPALNVVSTADESRFFTNSVSPGLLVAGTNILAVEVHQQSATSSDLSFDLELFGRGAPLAPSIHIHPVGTELTPGAAYRLEAAAGGSTPLSFQWQKDGTNLTGAVGTSLSLSNITTGDAGSYAIVVANASGSVTSRLAVITLPGGPTITKQPVSQTVPLTGTATFEVGASGPPTLAYQWYFNGDAIPGANGPVYQLANVQTNNAGDYSVVVSNLFGKIVSDSAKLTVTIPDTDGDGMPDWWEELHQLNKLVSADAAQDADGDGQSNLAEFLSGTDPRNASSVLALQVAREGNAVKLRFTTAANTAYTIQRTDNINSGIWTKLTDISASPSPRLVEITDPAATPARFYRVVTPPTVP